MAQVPTEEKRFFQPNDGEVGGNVYATWNIDLKKNKGRIGVGNPLKTVIDTADDADLDGYAGQILEFGTNIYALTDVVFKASTASEADFTDGTNWSQDTSSGTPTVSHTSTDALEFDGLLIAIDGADLLKFNGTTWSTWKNGWNPYALEVGASGNLYVLTDQNTVYNVYPDGSGTGTVVVPTASTPANQGSLDFSARAWEPRCMESSSTRLFIGFSSTVGDNSVIAEWDMGEESISANRIHEMGAVGVMCIPIIDDTPIAILNDGSVKIHNGVSFVDYEGIQFPEIEQLESTTWIHKNGWAIIDDLVHLLANPRANIQNGTTVQETTENGWNNGAGVWCLDPKIGLYNRFALTKGASTDYGQMNVSRVGALFARKHSNTKFLASYDYMTNNAGTTASGIFFEDKANTRGSRAFIALPFMSSSDAFKEVEMLHRKLDSGDELRAYFRRHSEDSVVLDGTWADTTHFNTEDSTTGIVDGDVILIKSGSGAGQIVRVSSIQRSGVVSSIEVDEANTMASENDQGVFEVTNFKRIGKTDNNTLDWHKFTVPSDGKPRKIQVLIEIRQAAGNKAELDSVIIT